MNIVDEWFGSSDEKEDFTLREENELPTAYHDQGHMLNLQSWSYEINMIYKLDNSGPYHKLVLLIFSVVVIANLWK